MSSLIYVPCIAFKLFTSQSKSDFDPLQPCKIKQKCKTSLQHFTNDSHKSKQMFISVLFSVRVCLPKNLCQWFGKWAKLTS